MSWVWKVSGLWWVVLCTVSVFSLESSSSQCSRMDADRAVVGVLWMHSISEVPLTNGRALWRHTRLNLGTCSGALSLTKILHSLWVWSHHMLFKSRFPVKDNSCLTPEHPAPLHILVSHLVWSIILFPLAFSSVFIPIFISFWSNCVCVILSFQKCSWGSVQISLTEEEGSQGTKFPTFLLNYVEGSDPISAPPKKRATVWTHLL